MAQDTKSKKLLEQRIATLEAHCARLERVLRTQQEINDKFTTALRGHQGAICGLLALASPVGSSSPN